MLRQANIVDLPMLRALIREGALAGSVDPDLATDSREATMFFSNLRQALTSGYFVEENPRTGDFATVEVSGYIYLTDDDDADRRPIGFGLFRAATIGYEFWLSSVDAAWRGRGHGRAMVAALLATPQGRMAYVARVKTASGASPAMAHLLRSFGYEDIRETPRDTWYLRIDAPEALRKSLRAAPTRRKTS